VRKWIGAFAAALGGVDTLIFAGGIGENASIIRQRICAGLGFLDMEINPRRNQANEELISSNSCRVKIRVMRTNEELVIARSVLRFLRSDGK
jgi:acetate kinase